MHSHGLKYKLHSVGYFKLIRVNCIIHIEMTEVRE